MHETHTFSTEPTPLEKWTIARDEECWAYAGTNHSLGGVIDGCRERGIDLVPTFFALATPSGLPDQSTVETLITELVERLERALPADGIILTLHGAMVGEGFPD